MSTLRPYSRLLLGVAAAALLLAAGCGSRPAAIVNGTKISEADLDKQLRKADGLNVLAGLIDQQITRDAFAATKMTITQEDITALIEARFGNYQQFQQLAAQQGINPQEYIDQVVKRDIMREKLATKDLPVTDAILKDFYTKNKAHYDQPETFAWGVIVASGKADGEKALAALKGGADFATVVAQYSIDTKSRDSGGQMPAMPLSQVPPQLAAALSHLKDGEYSPVTQFSPGAQMASLWAIVKLNKRTAAQSFTFEQVKSKVEQDYRGSKLTQQTLESLVNTLHKQAKVAVVDADFQALNEEYRSAEIPQFGAEGLTPAAGGKPATAASGAVPAVPAQPATPPAAPNPAGP